MSTSEKHLKELLDLMLDGTISDVEREEFGALLDSNHELAPNIIEQLRIHSYLQWQSGFPQASIPGSLADNCQRESVAQHLPVNNRRALVRGWRTLAAAAFLIGLGIYIWHLTQQPSSRGLTKLAVAEIVKEDSVDWSAATTALKDQGQIVPGKLEMESGSLTLRFRSGATMTATGPASIQIESDMLVRLNKGQATTHVPHWARGFTVETPDAKIVDLGTRFGVDARTGGLTDVVVFEGEVDVTPSSGNTELTTRLTQGEAARVDNQGSLSRIVEVHQDHWGENWSTNELTPSRSVFKSIRDNIQPDESAKYYEIVPHGLVDDAPAYVDRRHQWNGMTSAGLPELLRGADYVKTFNDYKYRSELQIDVELSVPAIVYVFSDDRVPIPEWLSSQFENTGIKIGLDEGPWPEINPNDPTLSTAAGPGKSIDNTFTVWRRRCENAESLVLGATGVPVEACAIYGIAAKPID